MASGLLERVSLAVSGIHGAGALEVVLRDWFDFLGGRPGEVVYVDGGSGPGPAMDELERMKRAGMIDTLHAVAPDAWENHRDRCYVQEWRSGALCTRDIIVFAKLDTLPYRRGHGDWLAQDVAALEQPGVMAISMAGAPKPISVKGGARGAYVESDFVSLCFAIMKRGMFEESMRAQMGAFIDSNFQGAYPEAIAKRPEVPQGLLRALVELAWTEHCRARGLVALGRRQSREWQVNHVNVWGPKLLPIREAYRARIDIERTLDSTKEYRGPRPRGKQITGELSVLLRSLRGAAGLRTPREGERAVEVREALARLGRAFSAGAGGAA